MEHMSAQETQIVFDISKIKSKFIYLFPIQSVCLLSLQDAKLKPDK